jgi:hypothetical protein
MMRVAGVGPATAPLSPNRLSQKLRASPPNLSIAAPIMLSVTCDGFILAAAAIFCAGGGVREGCGAGICPRGL